MNKDNNSLNLAVNLPHILLYKIINYLDCNLDRITFSLVYEQNINDILIPENVSQLIFENTLNQSMTSKFYERLANSNVRTIEFRGEVDFKFEKIPSNIKEIIIEDNFPFKCLPDNLETISFGNYEYDETEVRNGTTFIRTSLLPKNLKEAEFRSYPRELQLDTFPQNLETLRFEYISDCELDNLNELIVFPTSIKEISMKLNWLPNIKPLKSIQTMYLYLNYNDIGIIQPGDIPQSVTELHLSVQENIPLESQSLSLTKEILPSRLKKLEFLEGPYKMADDLLSQMTQLKYLRLNVFENRQLPTNFIPATVKELHLQLANDIPLSVVTIPPSVESLYIENYSLSINEEIASHIPPTVKRLYFNNGFLLNNDIQSIPNTISLLTMTTFHSRKKVQLKRLDNENYILLKINDYYSNDKQIECGFINYTQINQSLQQSQLF
ncbi:hypothetical protein PPL_06178 [Heterostelium album PN500]|uniref:FNIP repeat-containing protein n=1 Tax=Heterostelium pallidum (strain ATCC 26659 / Pp 5 / PN500) TaxID=670386 RepID=D3BCF3_HETP5|nr:hypothetical protein PPL_06178 [Heterostelium album PN500]EFA80943.1 hypothetical protein PPL_06178 [Heterostelium album PN500]|eukprot:XP_020433061.1 hypothetical protein PPL_06178 [Heterostelium album PN500]